MARYEILGHKLFVNQWERIVTLYLASYYHDDYVLYVDFWENDSWRLLTHSRGFYENRLEIRIPNEYYYDSIIIRIEERNEYTGQSDYTSPYGFFVNPEITSNVPVTPSPGEEVQLYLNGDFRDANWRLEYISGDRWEEMPKSEMRLYSDVVIVRIPPTFSEHSMTVGFGVYLDSSPRFSPDYTFNIASPKDKIQYNQNGTIRNMEAKYNHNGVIRDVECWYNHNGVLKKIQ